VQKPPRSPIFYDPQGRRWRRVKGSYIFLAIGVTALAAVFIASVLANPLLPHLNIRPVANLPHSSDIKPKPLAAAPHYARAQKAKHAQMELQKALANAPVLPAKRPSQTAIVPPPRIPMPAPVSPGSRPLSIGFYINWDESSYASLLQNLDHLDWVVPQWVHLTNAGSGSSPIATDIHAPALNLIRQRRPQTSILPMVQNLTDEKWEPEVLSNAIADEPARQGLIAALSSFVEQNKFAGICIDFEEPATEDQPHLLLFMQELHAAFQSRGWLVAQAVPFDDPDWHYRDFAAASDYLMLMAYDQHWASSEDAGPVAGQDWFEQDLSQRMNEIDPSKTIVCLGNYGYDWAAGSKTAKEVTVQEALISAKDSEAEIGFDPASHNPHFDYDEDDGSRHAVWFLDAATAYNQIRAASGYHPAGFALWRLGSEDPSLWSVFGVNQNAQTPEPLRRIVYGYEVDFEGTGELLKVQARPHDGERSMAVDSASGFITSEKYLSTPSSYVIERAGDHPGLIALTFDDGPDPLWTPRILDILKQENVPATFFVIGRNGQAYPDLLRRVVNEGHEIGNHTFTHPNLGEIPLRITDLELNATQRLIESETGRSTVLFRPPFFGDAEADKPEEVEPAFRAQQMGYLLVGLRLDPSDWQTPVSADEIVNRTVRQALSTDPDQRGQVVLLHDSGGDRSATVAALPNLIHELRRLGFRFVLVSELAGLSRDQVNPVIPPGQSVYTRTDAVAFYLMATGGWLLQWIFLLGIALGLGRLFVIGALAGAQWLRARSRSRRRQGGSALPMVSVIVPAYNEERVITRAIESLLKSDYPNYEIIVVDDGSQDQTADVVRELCTRDERLRLFVEPNRGKAAALNVGLSFARGGVIVALDADTIFPPHTIGALAARFEDPETGAVAGNAKVGNRINIITRWQSLEYITSQNMDRRAFASLNCITVVPGAVGAWRRELIDQAGGFSSDTLAEDQDLTLCIRKLGYKIGYEEEAIAWTEAPDTLSVLARQRYRWAFGTLQCMWKHRHALFNPRYGALGWIAMPHVWIFQILFPLVSPVMDLILVYTLFVAGLERLQQGTGYSSTNLRRVLFYYALFLAVDWCAAGFAFLLERRENWRLLWWLFLQRFCYRQIMYYVMLKSVATAVRGAVVGWDKLERKATVEVQP
jgi:cellulose synthase/poly-beta-1,6-N-acetylglucosamine synthase-like glycosyltransferase/peptidoglycan/xylan/chitin deacetylase (PgdA/CDA1 family)/spore germination protein YaaH